MAVMLNESESDALFTNDLRQYQDQIYLHKKA